MTDRCDNCGRKTPINELDGKPGAGHFTAEQLFDAAERGEQFDRLECGDCYGPNYISLGSAR